MSINRRTVLGASLALPSLATHQASANQPASTTLVFLASDYATNNLAEEIYTQLTRAAARLGQGEALLIYDARRQRQISRVAVPDDPNVARTPRLRAQHLQRGLASVQQYLQAARTAQPEPDLPAAYLNPTALAGYLRQEITSFRRPIAVVFLGSALHADPRDSTTSMLRGFYPSDGHFRATSMQSPYGVADRRQALEGVQIHWCTSEGQDGWIRGEHRSFTHRTWGLFIAGQGGQLATFSDEPRQCLDRAMMRETGGASTFTADPSATALTMNRVPLDIAAPAVLPADTTAMLARMQLAPADRARLEAGLRANRIQLVELALHDTQSEDDDRVAVLAEGIRFEVALKIQPQWFVVPVGADGNLRITGTRDGGGGITVGITTRQGGALNVPPIRVGETIDIPVRVR